MPLRSELDALTDIDGVINKADFDALVQAEYDLPYPPDHYYMPIPSKRAIIEQNIDCLPIAAEDAWLDEAAIDGFLAELAVFTPELSALPDYWQIHAKLLGLGYGEAEGQTYYAVVRASRPDVLVEFGSGLSTYYAVEAVKANGGDTRIICVEPYPAPAFVEYCADNAIELIRQPVQSLDLSEILGQLTERSLVFIDTTHVLRADGELWRFFLEVLPAVPKGALAHFHDIFFPWPVIFREHDAFSFSSMWNESLTLAIYLRENPHWKIIHPGYWLARERREKYWAVFPKAQVTGQIGSCFWMRRT